ncbi:zinc finger domain-containing protein, partial [Arthrobacter sp. H5]|uniref:Fpg/Nei family DNA glycosylase n=1 Tax=Arthrobacter sp. H5 TaxID=1267973 RepID=UPI0005628268
DLRGPTACEVITEAERDVVVSQLGPDPLSTESAPGAFLDRLRRSRSPVALLLMNQAVIAGVGNVYRAEVLFRQRINPRVPGSSLDGGQAAGLWNDLVAIMGDGVRDGRIITTTADHRSEGSGTAPPSEAHYVYKRAALPCRVCGTPVLMAELGARKLYWCPECQSG